MEASWKKNYVRYKTVLLGTLDQYQRKADIKIYIEIILSLVTVSIFSVFALKPTLTTIAQLIKDIDAKKEVLGKMENKIDQLKQAQVTYDNEREHINNLLVAVPFTPQPNIFIRQIEGSSNQTAQVRSLSIGEAAILGLSTVAPKNSDSILAFPENVIATEVSIGAQAPLTNYQSTFEFFKMVENLRTAVKVDTFSMTSEESEEGEKIIVVQIDGRILSMKKTEQP